MKRIISAPGLRTSCFAAVFGALALLGCAQNTLAARLVDVTVVNRNTGERLTPYRHEGKLYVAGTPGNSYSVELRSLRGERLMAVLSVDGVNVLTGQTAATLQSGYVIEGRQRYAINGWRKSMNDVAQFVFTELSDSYAARTGRPGNVGVIGVAVFREKYEPPPAAFSPSMEQPRRAEEARDSSTERQRPASAEAEPASKGEVNAAGRLTESGDLASSDAVRKSKQIGTGHGEREYAPTRYTEFKRSSEMPDEIVTIYYDSRTNLIARGIIPSSGFARPQPFPGGAGFVPDPRG